MPLPEEFNFKEPIEVPDAHEDLELIRDVIQAALADENEGLVVATIGEGEDQVRATPNPQGGFSITAGSVMGNREAMELGEGQSSSRSLAFDGLLRVVRATIEVGTQLPGDELGISTKRIPQAGLKAFIGSIASTVRRHK